MEFKIGGSMESLVALVQIRVKCFSNLDLLGDQYFVLKEYSKSIPE